MLPSAGDLLQDKMRAPFQARGSHFSRLSYTPQASSFDVSTTTTTMPSEADFCILVVIGLYISMNFLDFLWIYQFAQATVYPNPRNALNSSTSGYHIYQYFMHIFGFCLGWLNFFVAAVFLQFEEGIFDSTASTLFTVFIAIPIAFTLIVIPFFGGWIGVPLAQDRAWNHHCDSFPVYAIIDATGSSDPSFVLNAVHFYQRNSPNSMFSYIASNDKASGDIWNFDLKEWDQPQDLIPDQFYPTLRQLTYNFTDYTFTGYCAVPASDADGNSAALSRICTQGTFNPGNYLYLNISSNVPPKSTTNSGTDLPFNNTQLRTVDGHWAASLIDGFPSFSLRIPEGGFANRFQDYTVMQTGAIKGGDCTRLKVCLGGARGQVAGAVGAETLVPLGIAARVQAAYAQTCSN